MTETVRSPEGDAPAWEGGSAGSILANIADGLHVVDKQGRFTYINRAAREMFQANGLDPRTVLGQSIFIVFPDLEENPGGRTFLQALRQREPTSVESYYARWNRWFYVRHHPLPDGGVATLFYDVTAQKQSEAALREQRARFDFATDAGQIGYWFCDLPFDKLAWDARVKEHFWLPPNADVDIGLFYDRIHPDDRTRTRNAIEESIANHTRYDIEYRTVSPNGEQKWIRAIGRTAYDAANTPLRFDGVTLDITELKKAQQTIRENERQFEAFANAMPTLAWMARPDGSSFWYNRRWYQYTGTTPQEMEGWGWQSVHDPAILPEVVERWKRSLETAETFEMVFPLRGADGSFRHFLTRVIPIRDESGAITHWFGTNTDVEEQRRVRLALDAERRRLAAVFENAPIGLVFADKNGRIISGNARAEQMFGHPILYSPDIESYREWIAFHPDGRRVEGHEFPLAKALTDGQTHSGEYMYERGDGRRIWVEFTGAPIRDASGAIIGGVVATTDIDARKRAEQALVRNEKLVVVGRMAATISHEINNPLESVTNLLYLIGQTSSDNTVRLYTRTAQQELARVSHIVTHTLRYNRQTTAAQWENVGELLDSAIAIYAGRMRSAGVVLERDYGDTSPLLCFGTELRQVFANLLGNAFDATKRGGRIVVRTRAAKGPAGDAAIRITVADTGQGMDSQTLRRIFEPFFTTKGDNGTGLGLWVSREILNRHRARLRIRSGQSPRGSGSVFSVWFPGSVDPPRPAAQPERIVAAADTQALQP